MVTLTGSINFGAFLSGYYPSGECFIIAVDGTHHAIALHSGQVDVGCAETNSVIYTVLSADWETGLTDRYGVIGSEFEIAHVIGCPGTPDFIILGQGGNSQTGNEEVIGLRYRVNSAASVEIVGGYRYTHDDFPAITWLSGAQSSPVAQSVIGDRVYYVIDYGQFFTNFSEQLTWLPLDADGIDLGANGWGNQRTTLPSSMGATSFWGVGARNYTKQAAIYEHASGIGVFAFHSISEGETEGTLYHTVVNPTAHTTTGMSDVSSSFGIPFADETLQIDGGAGGLADEYQAPDINVLSDGRLELLFMRGDSDDNSFIRVRRYVMNNDLSGITALSTLTFDLTALSITTYEASFGYREGGVIHWMIKAADHFYFGSSSVASPGGDDECGAEDEADELTTEIEWPKCDFVPASINVEVVSPSISPGRSFTGIEQLIQPDAGHWRITYSSIPIRSKADALRWRGIESALSGRNNPILVHVYEAPLSSTPIVVTASGDYAIGATIVHVVQTAGEDIRAGIHFSDGRWLYRVKRVPDEESAVLTVTIFPPLRAAIADGASLDFNDPVCRCRLETDDGMDVNLELLRFANPSVRFVEDV